MLPAYLHEAFQPCQGRRESHGRKARVNRPGEQRKEPAAGKSVSFFRDQAETTTAPGCLGLLPSGVCSQFGASTMSEAQASLADSLEGHTPRGSVAKQYPATSL